MESESNPHIRSKPDSETSPIIGHLVTVFLNRTENWILKTVQANRAFSHVFLCSERANADEFDWPIIGKAPREKWNWLRSRTLGTYENKYRIEFLRDQKVTLLHAHFGWEGTRNLEVKSSLGLPMVTTFYGLDALKLPRRSWWPERFRRLFKTGECFVAEGPHLAGTLVKLGCPEEKVRVVPLGCDPERIPFTDRGTPGDRVFRLLLVGRMVEKKGHETALKALARLRDSHTEEVELVFLGSGPLENHLRRTTEQLGLTNRVRFSGGTNYQGYLDVLASAHLLLAPSVTAHNGDGEGGAPVVVTEAQASGLPVIGSTHCDIPFVLCPSLREYAVPERDPEALANSIHRLLESPGKMGELGRQAWEWVTNERTVGKTAQMLGEVYRNLLE